MEKFTIKYTKVVIEEVSFNKYIGIEVMLLRKKKGMTQEQLGNEIGLTRPSIINIEKGRQTITMKNLYLICNYFNIESKQIMPF